MQPFCQEFIEQCLFRLDENPPRIDKCLQLLTKEEVWQKPNPSSNSIGHLILHLCGNIQQYAISSLGHLDDNRLRDEEFSTDIRYEKAELINMLGETLEASKKIILSLNDEDWLQVRSVQGFEFTGVGILIHVVEHLSYHTGQIAFYTKALKNEDLGFYGDLNLNIKNKIDS